jgi:KipI family sensor histidine kinase inhibitor
LNKERVVLNTLAIRPAGDTGLYIVMGDTIDVSVNAAVHRLANTIQQQHLSGVLDVVPGYASLYLEFDPAVWSYGVLAERLMTLKVDRMSRSGPVRPSITIPVCYGGEYGPDLEIVAQNAGMSTEEVVSRHTAAEYHVYFIGFTPGFPFLGGMDPRLEIPRLEQPRTRVPQGSVGIAGMQTGVYPVASPGGWRLIGRTSARLYTPEQTDPILLRPGDAVRFVAVSTEDYEAAARDGATAAHRKSPHE